MMRAIYRARLETTAERIEIGQAYRDGMPL
jgi:hypothetical protein